MSFSALWARTGRLVLAVGLLGAVFSPVSAQAAPAPAGRAGQGSWVSTWAAGAMAPSALATSTVSLRDQTVRNIVHTSAGGGEVRIRLSNAFGDRAVRVGSATIAHRLTGAAVDPATLRRIRFQGASSVTLPVGGSVLSDPVRLPVPARGDLAVSIYLPDATGPATYHQDARQTSYLAGGDHTADVSGKAYPQTLSNWFFVTAVQVAGPARGTVVAVGDSITDGTQGTWDANTRWPDFLARRLAERYGPAAPGVANVGISGNRVLNDSVCFGPNLLSRLDRDVFDQPGVHTIVLLEGINDLGFSQVPGNECTAPSTTVSAAELIAAYQQVIRRAHAHGIRIYGATLTPAQGFDYWNAEAEAKRLRINDWIRTSAGFDGVVDTAALLATPGRPEVIDPRYDSGDHLHPNDAGYEAIGNAVFAALTR